jgi:hypothetical protein
MGCRVLSLRKMYKEMYVIIIQRDICHYTSGIREFREFPISGNREFGNFGNSRFREIGNSGISGFRCYQKMFEWTQVRWSKIRERCKTRKSHEFTFWTFEYKLEATCTQNEHISCRARLLNNCTLLVRINDGRHRLVRRGQENMHNRWCQIPPKLEEA